MKYMIKSEIIPEKIKKGHYCHPQERPMDIPVDGYVLPGIIDIHFHGAMGWDFSFGDETQIEEMLDATAAAGITGILATIITSKQEQLEKSLIAIKNIVKRRKTLPFVHGIYLEGPFLSPEQRGAHPLDCLLTPSIESLKKWQEMSEGLIKVITVAPELPNAIEFIIEATKMGIKVALGHSSADWETTQKAVKAGAESITHVFNAMPQIHHRKPNITSYAMTDKNLSLEVIADCEHVSPQIIQMVFQTRESDKFILISDSMALTGLSDGCYEFYNQTLEKTTTRAKLPNGGFFGGAVMLPKSMARLADETGISWGTIGKCVWRNPCDFLNIQPPDLKIYFDTKMNWLATNYNNSWYIPA